jgi:hypothetical protein
VDRRAELGSTRTEVVNRIHRILLEIVPGGAKKFLTRGQASDLLRTAPAPVGVVAQTRHQLARELIDELTVIDAKIRAADKQLRQLATATGSSLASSTDRPFRTGCGGPDGCTGGSAGREGRALRHHQSHWAQWRCCRTVGIVSTLPSPRYSLAAFRHDTRAA